VKSWPGCKSPDTGSGQRRQTRPAGFKGGPGPCESGVSGAMPPTPVPRVATFGANPTGGRLEWLGRGAGTLLVGVQRRTVYGRFFKGLPPLKRGFQRGSQLFGEEHRAYQICSMYNLAFTTSLLAFTSLLRSPASLAADMNRARALSASLTKTRRAFL